MTQLPPRDVLSVKEVARIRGEDIRTVQRKARTGVYPAQKLPGRTGAYVIDRAGLERIIEIEDGRLAS